MWHAVETSIQSFNRSRRGNPSLKKNNTPDDPISRPTYSMTELMKRTNFSRDQIRHLYRRFKQDSPSGQVTREQFSTIIGTLFPTGESYRYSLYLFQNIDRSNKNMIRFEDIITTFAILINGSVEDRLGWIFDLYDLNKDGILTKPELFQLLASIFQLIIPTGKMDYKPIISIIEERTDALFSAWDVHGTGQICKQDFLEYCLKNETIITSIDKLRADINL